MSKLHLRSKSRSSGARGRLYPSRRPFQGVAGAFERLMRWAGPRGLIRFPETKVLAVYHDNPDITETDKLRSSACSPSLRIQRPKARSAG